MKYLFIICFLYLTFSCNPCKNSREPWLLVKTTPLKNYTHFRIPNDSTYYPMSDSNVPLALNQDSTFLILKNGSELDTLSISYVRTVNYQKENCGYVVRLSNLKLNPTSSFQDGVFKEVIDANKNYSYALTLTH